MIDDLTAGPYYMLTFYICIGICLNMLMPKCLGLADFLADDSPHEHDENEGEHNGADVHITYFRVNVNAVVSCCCYVALFYWGCP